MGLKSKIAFYLMRMVKSQKNRNYFIKRKIKQIPITTIPTGIGKKIAIPEGDLNTKGYANLGAFLTEKEVENLMDQVKDFKCFDPFRSDLGFFKIDDVAADVHVANYVRKNLVGVKNILDIANNSDILTAAKDFLGATPTISNINMWWSLPNHKEAEQAQLFHRDVDDFKFCKLFVYLTDVDMDHGPHVYVEGSSASEKLRVIRRYQDEEITTTFGEDSVKYFTAPKGSSFMVDTYGFHKGLLPKNGRRLLLQVQYSLSEIGIENYEPMDIGAHSYDSYINRLILK